MKMSFEKDGDAVEIFGGDAVGDDLVDMRQTLKEGETFFDLTFEELHKAGSGTIDISNDGKATIEQGSNA